MHQIIAESLLVQGIYADGAAERVGELLDQVVPSRDYADRYPYQLSRGRRQRVSITRTRFRCWKADDACLTEPELTSADNGRAFAWHHPRADEQPAHG